MADNLTSDFMDGNGTVISTGAATPPFSVFTVFEGIVMLVIMMGAVTGNILVILSVYKYERLRVITNYFIVSLAFADLIVALIVMPFNFSIVITKRWIFGRALCDIFNSNDVLFSTASILHLCLISMDRYIAIMHPLQYETKMSSCRVVLMLSITWGASALISYIPIYSRWYTTAENLKYLESHPEECNFIVSRIYAVISSSVSFWTPSVIMVFVYAKIYREARRQEQQIHAICMRHMTNLSNGRSGSRDSDDCVERSEGKRLKREHKAAKTLGIIMGAFIMCWLPFFLWYTSSHLCGEENCPTPDIVVSILFWIGYFNSCLNPIIYAFFNRDFRTAFRKLLRVDNWCKRDPSTMALNATYTSDHRDSGTMQFTYDVSRRGRCCR